VHVQQVYRASTRTEDEMKTGKRLETNAHFLAKVPLNSRLKRLIWWAFRKYLLNEDHYVVRQVFTGPRSDCMNAYTLRANATHRRIYITPRKIPEGRFRVSMLPR
jgi:hypothetical protein